MLSKEIKSQRKVIETPSKIVHILIVLKNYNDFY